VTPNELFEEIASIVTQVTKKPFRTEQLTWNELDAISDRIMMLCEDEKAKLQMEREIDQAQQQLDARKERGQ
jgi:hypothetical protein